LGPVYEEVEDIINVTWRYAETSVFKLETICDKRKCVEYNVKDICINMCV